MERSYHSDKYALVNGMLCWLNLTILNIKAGKLNSSLIFRLIDKILCIEVDIKSYLKVTYNLLVYLFLIG